MQVDYILTHSIAEKIIYQGVEYTPSQWLVRKGLNCHGFFNPDGTFEPWIDTDKKAKHAGVSRWKDHNNLNKNSLGYEITIQGAYNWQTFKHLIQLKESFTDKMYQTMSEVYAQLCDQFGLDPRTDILLHNWVSGKHVRPKDPKIDPGSGFDYIRLVNMVKAEML